MSDTASPCGDFQTLPAAGAHGYLIEAFAPPNETQSPRAAEVGEVVLSPRPHEYLGATDVPDAWDWRNVNGRSLTTGIQNQHIPTYCGSCWNFAAMSSIADRLRIQTQGVYPAVMPSNQVLINCGDAGSCNGGDSNAANKWGACGREPLCVGGSKRPQASCFL